MVVSFNKLQVGVEPHLSGHGFSSGGHTPGFAHLYNHIYIYIYYIDSYRQIFLCGGVSESIDMK